METFANFVLPPGSDETSSFVQRLEGLTTPEEYDGLLYEICRERGFSEEEIEDIHNTNEFVTRTMDGHTRKDGVTPTCVHLKRVAIINAFVGADVFTIKHGLLHDIVEDTNSDKEWKTLQHPMVSILDLEELFGDDMAKAVASVSKVKTRYLKKNGNTGDGNANGDEKKPEDVIEANLPIHTHYRLFESLDNYRVVITKLSDRLDYFLTLNDHIGKPNRRRKALETLELYAPLAHILRMRWLRDELTKRALAIYSPKKADILIKNTSALYTQESMDDIAYALYGALSKRRAFDSQPDIFVFTPSWYRTLIDYGPHLEDVDKNSASVPVVRLAFRFDGGMKTADKRKEWLAFVGPWFHRLNREYGFQPGSWKRYREAIINGDTYEIETVVKGKSVILRFDAYDQMDRDLRPAVDRRKTTGDGNAAIDEFNRIHEHFEQLHSVWPADVASGSNSHIGKIVKEIMGNLRRPLVRVYGNDGKPAMFPKGATLFDAACFFGVDVARRASGVKVKRSLVGFTLPLETELHENDWITIESDEDTDNFTPEMLPSATTNLAKELLQKELMAKVNTELGLPREKRKTTRQLVGRGVQFLKGIYEKQARVQRVRHARVPRYIAPYFDKKTGDPAVRRIMKATMKQTPTYESFMVALAMGKLESKTKRKGVHAIVNRLIELQQVR